MKKKLLTLMLLSLTFGIMYLPAEAKESAERSSTNLSSNLNLNAFPQVRYVRYRGRLYRVRFRRYPRYRYYRPRRVRYYRYYRPRVRYYRYRRY